MRFVLILLVAALSTPTRLPQNQPRPVHIESNEYPPLARQARIQGRAIARVTITQEGKVGDFTLIEGHPLLAKAMESDLRTWVFETGSEASQEFTFVFVLHDPAINCPRTTVKFDLPSKVTIASNLQTIMGTSQKSTRKK